jgi:hypothetical protein
MHAGCAASLEGWWRIGGRVNHQFGSTADGKDCVSGPHLTNMGVGSIGGCIISQV